MDVKRYDPGMTYDPQPEGEYVLYSDYAALLADLTALREAVKDYEGQRSLVWMMKYRGQDTHASERELESARRHMLRLANQTGDTDHANR